MIFCIDKVRMFGNGNFSVFVVFFVISLFMSGCQPKVYLMPPPIGIKVGGELFNLSSENEDR